MWWADTLPLKTNVPHGSEFKHASAHFKSLPHLLSLDLPFPLFPFSFCFICSLAAKSQMAYIHLWLLFFKWESPFNNRKNAKMNTSDLEKNTSYTSSVQDCKYMWPIIITLSPSVSAEWNPIREKLKISKKAETRWFCLHIKFPSRVAVAFVKLSVSSLFIFLFFCQLVSLFLPHPHPRIHTSLISHHLSQLSLFSSVYPNVRSDIGQLAQWNSLALCNTWNSTNQVGYLLGAQGLVCCIHVVVCARVCMCVEV